MARIDRRQNRASGPLGETLHQEHERAHLFSKELMAMIAEARKGGSEAHAGLLADLLTGFEVAIDRLGQAVRATCGVSLADHPTAWRALPDAEFDYALERYCHCQTLFLTGKVLAETIASRRQSGQTDLRDLIDVVVPTYTEMASRGIYVWYRFARTDAGRTSALAKLTDAVICRLSERNRRLVQALGAYGNFFDGLVHEVPGTIACVGEEEFGRSSGLGVQGTQRRPWKPFIQSLRNAVARHLAASRPDPRVVNMPDADTVIGAIDHYTALPLDTDSPGPFDELLTKLSPQERRVADMWCEGLSHADIARELGVTRQTVNSIRLRIRKKLEALI